MSDSFKMAALAFVAQLALGAECLAWQWQMEKRLANLYEPGVFEEQFPAVGSVAPDLEMTDLAGNTVGLSDYSGKTVILVKAGYT
jgi:hypothetical protein